MSSSQSRPALPSRAARARLLLLATALWALVPSVGRAQQQAEGGAGSLQPTREELQRLLARYDSAAGSTAYTPAFRERARHEAGLVRTRLQQGDFQVGDQVALTVEGEPTLTATFTVQGGRVLRLPTLGEIPLAGVLRSELDEHLRRQISRYIREPVVTARSLVRISITGQVRQPGFYVVPAESLLSDALMAAGGPSATAKLSAIRVERGAERVWEGEPLRQAMVEGRTLDQMSIRAGDQVVVPAEGGPRGSGALRAITALPAALLAVVTLARTL